MCGQLMKTFVRNELAKRHDENERLTRVAKRIGELIGQRNDALELARELRICLNGTPYKGKATALVAILEGK